VRAATAQDLEESDFAKDLHLVAYVYRVGRLVRRRLLRHAATRGF
jgi:hypothetical protein